MGLNHGASFDGSHTYTTFGMIPKTILTFAPPPPKLVYEDVKGLNGELDRTEVLTNKIVYENRKGSFEFLVVHDDYMLAYEQCLAFFNGAERTCILDDDPEMHYKGRFTLSKWKSWEGYSSIVIDYNVEPYRYSEDNINLYDWEWDSLSFTSEDPILYHQFSVSGTKARTLYNLGDGDVTPTLTSSSNMEVIVDGITYQLPAGEAVEADFVLESGTTLATFVGTGTVTMDYPLESEI